MLWGLVLSRMCGGVKENMSPRQFASMRMSCSLFSRKFFLEGKRMKIHRSNLNNVFGKLRSIGFLFAVVALVLGAISFASLLVLAPSASAQKTTGLITGTVTDPSGAAVPGATVSVFNERTGV